jgi:O-antigen ligase
MGSLAVIGMREKSRPHRPAEGALRRTHLIVGPLLLLLIFFTTATVFVKHVWALESFQIGIYALVAGYLLFRLRNEREPISRDWAAWLVYLIPLWGIVQIAAHTTESTFETRRELLRWGALSGVFFLSQVVCNTKKARRLFLTAVLGIGVVMAILCLLQLFTSEGRVLWIFPSGYGDVYATFQNHNNFAQYIEVILPIALWRTLRQGWAAWWYPLLGGVLFASVIGSASRGGALLCTGEIVVMLLIGLLKLRNPLTGRRTRATTTILVVIPVLAAVFTLAVGWQRVWQRFQEPDSFQARREFLIAAVHMAEHRPLTGFGLGTFTEVYQRFAVKDFPFYANHAHNDWAEFAADGGIPFLLLVLIPFAVAIPAVFRHPWAIGLIAVMAHACVDYPFPRPAVSGWIFALLGALYMARMADKDAIAATGPPAYGTAKIRHISGSPH